MGIMSCMQNLVGMERKGKKHKGRKHKNRHKHAKLAQCMLRVTNLPHPEDYQREAVAGEG